MPTRSELAERLRGLPLMCAFCLVFLALPGALAQLLFVRLVNTTAGATFLLEHPNEGALAFGLGLLGSMVLGMSGGFCLGVLVASRIMSEERFRAFMLGPGRAGQSARWCERLVSALYQGRRGA